MVGSYGGQKIVSPGVLSDSQLLLVIKVKLSKLVIHTIDFMERQDTDEFLDSIWCAKEWPDRTICINRQL
jgi:hypothetical protein